MLVLAEVGVACVERVEYWEKNDWNCVIVEKSVVHSRAMEYATAMMIIDRQTDRHIERQTEIDTNRQTDRQTHISNRFDLP